MQRLIDYCLLALKNQSFDSFSFSLVDFKKESFSEQSFFEGQLINRSPFYDLASLTKPFTLGLSFLKYPNVFTKDDLLLLEHRSGLPEWGRLSIESWKEQLEGYSIKDTGTAYSDFGAMRLGLELEKKLSARNIYDELEAEWDQEVIHWKSLDNPFFSPATGFRNKHEIRGDVHDDNAFVIGERLCHAGLFGTLSGVAKTLVKMNQKYSLIDKIHKEATRRKDDRFIFGWDRSLNPSTSLAGTHQSQSMFGHLGFTGTSIWIYPEIQKGMIILSNATQNHWFEKAGINKIRRELSTLAWQGE